MPFNKILVRVIVLVVRDPRLNDKIRNIVRAITKSIM